MIRFDTLDKKPKLWNLAALSAVFAAVIIPLAVSEEQNLELAACVLQCVYFLIVPVLLFRAFVRQLRYNPYSYNTIFYFGFAVFSMFVLIAQIIITLNVFQFPDSFSFWGSIGALLSSAKDFMLISSPFLFLFSAALCISNIALIRREGFRPVNLLGIVLSVITVSGVVFIFFFDRYVSGSQFEVMMRDLAANLFSAIYLYFECMLLGTMFADAITARYEPEKDKDYMIILGCGLKKDGTPTPLLKGRIDRAIDFYNEQRSENGKELTFITSGGKGPNEIVSESASMKKYLTEHGIPEERIIEEDKSTDTFGNMKYSKEKIADSVNARIVFSTTGYHVFRSGIFSRRVKMRAVGIGAKTKWYFWPNAAVREFIGLLTKHKLKQALILGGMIAFYVALTLLVYL